MNPEQTPQDELHLDRKDRFISHALVEVRKYRWWPFGVHSAVLLDISLQGFKCEFTAPFDTNIGASYWLTIPLPPLGIFAPSKISCLGECRWFDANTMRFGGVFVELDKTQRLLIEQVVSTLSANDKRL
ncbi:MAG: PilZ domain-containing protein [Oligoflexales bacterium]